MYTHQVTSRAFVESLGMIIPSTFNTTADAVEIHAKTLRARVEAGEVDSFWIKELATGNVVARGLATFNAAEMIRG